MAGLDHRSAPLPVREAFAFTQSRKEEFYAALHSRAGLLGAVLVATCNRTELYLSLPEGAGADPFALLCAGAGVPAAAYRPYARGAAGDEVFRHLAFTACGMESQILGEDQIIAQVKDAVALARACGAADSVLEVLFRTAVTAAKRVKTDIRFPRQGASVATRALELLQPFGARRVLVIGNGEVGRLVANQLLEQDCAVTMTLRSYRHGAVPVPAGAQSVDYQRRYEVMPDYDAVVSATSSPHCTIEADALAGLAALPRVMIDLAVPRDIDPQVAARWGVTLYNMDTLTQSAPQSARAALLPQVQAVVDRYAADLAHWDEYRRLAM